MKRKLKGDHMHDYQKEYEQKLCSAEEAVKLVKDGDWIDYSHATAVPKLLDRALAERADEFEQVNVRGYLIYHPLAILEADVRLGRPVFFYNSWFMQGQDRKLLKDGYTSFIPMRYAELPEFYRRKEDIERVDVLMIQVGKMDVNGNFNLGPSIAHTIEVANRAKHIIVEVNENMPYVFGESDDHLHISQVDAIVESSEPIDTIPNITPNEVDKKIAELIMKEITDGATLQLGIGGMPNAVGYMIAESDLKDIGIHSEMYVDSMMAMTKSGVVTGRCKPLNRGKQVFTFALGSQELYEWMDHNQALLSAPVDYCNDPYVVAKLPNFISINNAMNADLFGQVNAESAGYNQVSGTGGQLDFVMGAYMSHGGKSIIAFSSTRKKKDGTVESRIVPTMPLGTIMTDTRTTTHYIATEYGMVNLKGKSMWQRAELLISIAHPDFRDALIKQAQDMHIWKASNKR